MQITFCGAAGTVTGSKHLLTLDNGRTILLDCGLFQGLGVQTDSLNTEFGFTPSDIDCLLLSHAHIDHSGAIPRLVKEGFAGKIYATTATAELTEILLHDSASIQVRENDENEELYNHEDVMESAKRFQIVNYNESFCPIDGVEVIFISNGHVAGSAAIYVKIKENGNEKTLLYSGDVGKTRSALLKAPDPVPLADYIIMESTYGDSHHAGVFNNVEEMRKWIEDTCVKRNGKLIIPAFSVGRTQEILYLLNQLSLEKLLPEINVYIDSPLGLRATQTIKKYAELFNDRLQSVLEVDDDPFEFVGLKYIETVEQSRQLQESDEPCIIISSSGTGDAGRVRHHIRRGLEDGRNSILFSGYCSPDSLGGQLLKGASDIEFLGKTQEVAAKIGKLNGMSAHGDCDDLLRYLETQDAKKVKEVFLVHGEPEVQKVFKEKLLAKGFNNVSIPSRFEKRELT